MQSKKLSLLLIFFLIFNMLSVFFVTDTVRAWSVSTQVNNISPYLQSSSPLTITASGAANLSNISLFYRFSADNVSWSSNVSFVWQNTSQDDNKGGTLANMNYPNTAKVLWHNSSTVLAYVAVYTENRLTILNVTDNSHPVQINSVTDADLTGAHDIQIVDYTANERVAFLIGYTGTNKYITSWNVTDPYNIVKMDGSPPSSTKAGMYLDVDVDDKILYATWYGTPGTFSAYDISDPSNIQYLNSSILGLNNPWYPLLNKNNDNYVYVGNIGGVNKGISIYNVSNPSGIVYVKNIYTQTSYPQLKMVGDYIYVIDNNNLTLSIFDVTDPENWVLKSNKYFNVATHLWVDDHDIAYLRIYDATVDNGLRIVDVSNKTNPVNITSLYYNASNHFKTVHWETVQYNNVTNKYVLYGISYVEDAWIMFDLSYDWTLYSVDSVFPWSWSFNFPDGVGYYEFYSQGKRVGYADESVLVVKDAMCHYVGGGTNSNPVNSNEKPTSGSTGINIVPSLNITVTDPDGDSMNVSFYTNATGAWGLIGTNSSVGNGTYRWTNGSMNSYNTKYWWNVSTNDGMGGWDHDNYTFTTKLDPAVNYDPVNSVPSPSNNSINVALNPTLYITVTDPDGDLMNVTFSTNESGSWVNIGGYNNIGNGTKSISTSCFSSHTTKYWWNVSTNDGMGGWDNDTYVFTTRSGNWWDGNWEYFITITIDSSLIDTDLVNFTLLVPLSTDVFNKSNNAASIRFIDTDNSTVYYHDIEAANSTNGVLAWVKVPRISSTVDTVFLCYYGNPFASNSSDPVNTWSNNVVVSYMKDQTTSSVRDYTGSPWHNFTKGGGIGHPAMVAGKINYAQDFEATGGTDYLITGDHDELSFISGGVDTSFSMMFWLKLEGGGGAYQSLINKIDYGAGTHREYMMYLYTGADPSAKGYNVRLYNDSSGGYIQARAFDAVNYSSGDWHFITITYSGNTNGSGISIYHNGTNSSTNVSWGGSAYTAMENKNADVLAGRYSNGAFELDGILDDLHISKGYCWNASWVKAEFHSTNMSSSFLAYGSEVARGNVNPPGNLSVNTSSYNMVNLTWTVDTTFDYTHIRRSTTGYPSSRTDGTFIYNDTGTSFDDTSVSGYTVYYYTCWGFNSSSKEWSSGVTGWNHTGPLDPSNIVAWIKGTGLNITWNYGTRSNQTVLVYKNNSYPASVSDGTILYNGTNRFYNDTSYTTSRRYRLYSWNDTVRLFSSGVDVPWGALIINCYNESSGLGITFDVLISSADGSQVYTATGCTNPRIINISQCPQGAGVSILVSSTGYNDRVYYLDIYPNQFYTLNAYLPPITVPGGGGGGGAEQDCVQRQYIDSVTVTNPAVDAVIVFTHTLDEIISVEIYNNSLYGSYGGWIFVPSDKYTYNTAQVTINESVLDANTTMARVTYYYEYCEGKTNLYVIQVVNELNQPLDAVSVTLKVFINATGKYETITNGYTTGSGEFSCYLLPNKQHKVVLSKDGYTSKTENFITDPTYYGAYYPVTFKLYTTEISEDMWGFITHSIEPTVYDLFSNFTMYFNISCDTGILEWFRADVYLYNSTSDTWGYIWGYNNSNSSTGGYISYNVSSFGRYGFMCTFKLDNYSSYTFGSPHSSDKVVFVYWNISANVTSLETITHDMLGDNPIYVNPTAVASYIALVAASIVTFVMFTFSPQYSGLGVIGIGFILGLLKGPLSLIPDNVFNWALIGGIIILGVLMLWYYRKVSKTYGG